MFVFGKQVMGSTYVKLLVALKEVPKEMSLDTLLNLSCRFRNSKMSFATSIVN